MTISIANTIENVPKKNLCTGCGTCVGVCALDALNMRRTRDSIYIPFVNPLKCTQCKVCVQVCPGYVHDSQKLNRHIFGKEPEDSFLGNYISCYIGHSQNERVRYESSSGGVATTLLLFALKRGIINGAIVTKMSNSNPLEPEVFIARTKDEIILASKSKYCPVPINSMLKNVLTNDRLAIVGLPCHIHGLRKAELLTRELKDRIILRIGLFCGHTVNFSGTEFLLERMGINVEDVVELDYRGKGWPGGMTIKLKDGSERFLPLQIYWGHFFAPFFFTPIRCTFCNDGTNELADISLGDAWLPELRKDDAGESIIVVRTPIGKEVFQKAVTSRKLKVNEIKSDKVIQSQKGMLNFKKKGVKARISLVKILGKGVPKFEILIKPRLIYYLATILTYLNICISSRRVSRRLLKSIPLPILRLYIIAFNVINYVGLR